MQRNPDPNRTQFTAFITKYALTDGIVEVVVEDCFNASSAMVGDMNNSLVYYHKPDWHRTREGAVERAEKMRQAKILSVKKQLDKLENMKFS